MRPSPRAAAAAACALLCWFAPPARASAPIPFSRYHCDIQNAHGLRLHAWVPSAGADTTLGFTSVDAAANAWEVSPVAGAADGYTVRAATGMRSGAWLHLDAAGALVLLDAQPAGAWWNITCGIVSELRHAHCAFTHSSAAQPTLTRASIRAVTEHDDYLTSAHHHVEYHFWTYAHIGLSPGGGLVSDLDAPFQTWDFRKVPGRANHYWIVEADGAGRMIWHDTAAPCAYVSYQAGCPGDPPLNISAFVEDASLAWEVNHLHGRFYTLRAAASGLYLQAWSPDIEGWEFDSLAFVAERRAWRIASALHPLEGEVAALKTVNANAPAGAHNRFVGFDAAGAFGDDFADPQPLELRGVDGAADTYDIVSRRRPEHTASSRVVQYARSRWTGTGTPPGTEWPRRPQYVEPQCTVGGLSHRYVPVPQLHTVAVHHGGVKRYLHGDGAQTAAHRISVATQLDSRALFHLQRYKLYDGRFLFVNLNYDEHDATSGDLRLGHLLVGGSPDLELSHWDLDSNVPYFHNALQWELEPANRTGAAACRATCDCAHLFNYIDGTQHHHRVTLAQAAASYVELEKTAGASTAAAAVFEICPVPATASPPVSMDDLHGWWRHGDADVDAGVWRNSVLGGADAAIVGTGCAASLRAGHGATGSVAAVEGPTACGIDFGAGSLPSTFTICSVTRYTGTNNRQRILQADDTNWLHGHHMGDTGVAFYNVWKTSSDANYLTDTTDWLLMCGSNANDDLVLLTHPDRIVLQGTSGGQGGSRLVVNAGGWAAGQKSDFAVAEVMVWDVGLTTAQMLDASDYLHQTVLGQARRRRRRRRRRRPPRRPPRRARSTGSDHGDGDGPFEVASRSGTVGGGTGFTVSAGPARPRRHAWIASSLETDGLQTSSSGSTSG